MGKPHEQLEAWKLAMQSAKAVYDLTVGFPAEERYGLAQQMRRAAVSIPSYPATSPRGPAETVQRNICTSSALRAARWQNSKPSFNWPSC